MYFAHLKQAKGLKGLYKAFMYIYCTTCLKCLVTFGAGKWFLHYEDPFMILNITTCFKCLATIVAGKWLLSCVCCQVSLIVTQFGTGK